MKECKKSQSEGYKLYETLIEKSFFWLERGFNQNIVISSSQDLGSFKVYPLRARRGEKKATTTTTEISFFSISNGLMEKWPPIKMRG